MMVTDPTSLIGDPGAEACGLLSGELCLAHLAHVIALRERAVMSDESSRILVSELLALRTSVSSNDLDETLRLSTGSTADWLYADRSRSEAMGTAFVLMIRKRVLQFARGHLAFAETAVRLADQHRDLVISNTCGPLAGSVSTLGHCLLTFVYPAFRDLERLQHCYRGFNSCPAGVGQHANGARLSIDRECLRSLLGFDDTRIHTSDALWHGDGPIELMAAIVALLVNLNRMTDELRSWSVADRAVDVAWIRALTSGLLAKVPILASLGKDVVENPDGCVSVAKELCAALDGAGRAIEWLTLFAQRSAATVERCPVASAVSIHQTDMAEVIVAHSGISYSDAQLICGEIERLVAKGEVDLRTMTPEALEIISVQIVGRPVRLGTAILQSAMVPAQMVSARRGSGSVAPERVVGMVTECRARLVRENLWVSTARQRLEMCETQLISQAQRIAAGSD